MSLAVPGKSCLIGHSGFVGGNLKAAHAFDALYNRANIHELEGMAFDLVVCAAPDARKWWSNLHPEEDEAQVRDLIARLKTVKAGQIVLISTIDVFPILSGVDERFDCASLATHAYGRNRLLVETAVAQHFEKAHVVRLPALFGPSLKKNALFDMQNGNEVWKIDPSASFQWYDVERLWADIGVIRDNGIGLTMLATEPVVTADIRDAFFPDVTLGNPSQTPPRYDVKTIHASVFGGSDGYIMRKAEIMDRIGRLVRREAQARAS